MPKNNIYLPKENLAKAEEIREIKNEIPTYEEFMKTYENDGNLNYDDLSSGSIGEAKGHGPNPWGCERRILSDGSEAFVTYQTPEISTNLFHLDVQCYNTAGGGGNE
jgi:hypothetical protein